MGVGHVVGIEGTKATVVYTGKAMVEEMEQVARNKMDSKGETMYDDLILNRKYTYNNQHQYVTRKHKRTKRKESRTKYTVIATDGKKRTLNALDVIDEICNCNEVKAEEKIKLKYVSEESDDPRWVKKAKAKRLARNPNARACAAIESPKVGTGRKKRKGLQAGSSARPQNTRRAEMRAARRRVPQPGDVHPSTKD